MPEGLDALLPELRLQVTSGPPESVPENEVDPGLLALFRRVIGVQVRHGWGGAEGGGVMDEGAGAG
jgi:hypothetical protein